MPRLVRWPANRSVCIESGLIVLSVHLTLPLLLVDVHYLVELDKTRVPTVQLRDQFAELKLLEMKVQSLQHSLEVVNVY